MDRSLCLHGFQLKKPALKVKFLYDSAGDEIMTFYHCDTVYNRGVAENHRASPGLLMKGLGSARATAHCEKTSKLE